MPPAIKNPWLKPFQWLRRSPNKPPKSGVQKVWFISIWTFLGICIYLLAVDNNLFWLFGSSPSLQSLQKPRLELPSEVFSYDKGRK
jgi:penicillin-binding protein 1A